MQNLRIGCRDGYCTEAEKKEQQHQKDMAEAVQNAVGKAAEDAKKQEQQHQKDMEYYGTAFRIMADSLDGS